MTQLLNQFNQTPEKGQITPIHEESAFQCQVSSTEATPLVSAQAVKIEDVAGSITRVTTVTDVVNDEIFGFVPYGFAKSNDYDVNDTVKIFTDGTTMLMEASAAIAAGASLELVLSGQKVVTASTGKVIGTALQKATADGDLIRVLITTNGQ